MTRTDGGGKGKPICYGGAKSCSFDVENLETTGGKTMCVAQIFTQKKQTA